MMTHRERMLATIMGEPTDALPFAPRMDLWAIALQSRGTLPDRFANSNMVQVAEKLDVACHAVGGDYTLPGGRDVSLRGLGIDNHGDYPYRVELAGVPVRFQADGENLRTRITTPYGDIFTHLFSSHDMKREGISLPFVKSYAIESLDDLDAMAYIFEHLRVIPTPEAYRAFQQRVGDMGLAVARGPVAASPIHLMLHELMPMDQFFYFYMDARPALQRLAERMVPYFEACLDALADSGAEVVFWGANYDQDLTWPPFFEAEIMPWLQKASARLHAAQKYVLTHTDGENRALLPYYPHCGFDIAESVCPAPMTHCSLAELRAGMGSRVTIWGGIPSVSLLPDSMSDAEFECHIDAMYAALGTGERLILGVSDNVPPDANLDRLLHIRDRAAAFGPVNQISA